MNLNECRILLTGATGGIGQELVAQLCEGGAHLLLAGRSLESLERIRLRFPDQISVVQADLSQHEGRETVFAAANQFGALNGLINAAGINAFGLLEQQDEDAIAHLIQVNLISTMQLTQRILPILRQSSKAFILNVGSTFGSIGYPGFTTYCASKFALRGFSEALRRELADTRIKVMYVAPRATRTTMNDSQVIAMNEALKVAMDDPKSVARCIAAAVRAEKSERYLGWPEKLFVRINSILPHLVDGSLRKQLPIIQRFTKLNP